MPLNIDSPGNTLPKMKNYCDIIIPSTAMHRLCRLHPPNSGKKACCSLNVRLIINVQA